MRLSCTSDEIDSLEAMDDAALAKHVRDSLKKFRGSDTDTEAQDDDLTGANPGTPSHSGPSSTSLESRASRAGNSSANDRAQNLRAYGLSPGRIREIMTPSTVSETDREGAAKLIPGLNRL